MTQIITYVDTTAVPLVKLTGLARTTLDNAILVGVWSSPMTTTDDSVITAIPGTAGSITVQFSSDGFTWTNAASSPYTATFTGGVPPSTAYVRATASIATATLTVATPAGTNQSLLDPLTGGFVGPGSLPRIDSSVLRYEAAMKHIGSSGSNGVAFNQTTSLSSAIITTTLKIECEVDFVAARLVILNRAANAINANTAVIGVSETNAIDNSANMGSPVIGGTAYQQIAPAGTFNGWRAVTWAAAAFIDIAAASTIQQFALSDWIPLQSVPRADGGTRPLILIRTYRDGAANGNWSFNISGASGRTPSAAMRQRTIIASSSGTDAVTTLTNAMSLTTTAQPVFPIIRFSTPVLAVHSLGDSTVQCNAQAPEAISSWPLRACNSISSPSLPVVHANFGATSQTSTNFIAVYEAALAAGIPAPSVLIVEAASVNDDSGNANTIRTRELQLSNAARILALAQRYNIPYVIFSPLLPYNALDAAHDILRQGTNAAIKASGLVSGVVTLNMNALGTGATPDRWIPAYNSGLGANDDGIHPNALAFDEVMAPAAVGAISKVVGY